jgi:hypothetical protein
MENQTESASTEQRAGKFIDKLKDDGLQRVRSGQHSAATQLEGVAAAIDHAGAELKDQPTLAAYAGELANTVSGFANRVRSSNLDDLLANTQRFARNNPGLFLVASIGAGALLARFLRTSGASRYETENQTDNYTGAGGTFSPDETYAASAEDSGFPLPADDDGAVPQTVDSPSYGGRSSGNDGAGLSTQSAGGKGGFDA